VLVESPPALKICASSAPIEVFETWLPSFPVLELRLSLNCDAHWSKEGIPALSCLLRQDERIDPAPSMCILTRLDHLRSLEVHVPFPPAPGLPAEFNGALLRSLVCLTRLSLSGFYEYDLEHLPQNISKLELEYGEVWRHDVLSSHDISIPLLPRDAHLDQLIVRKVGVIGLVMEELCDRVKHLKVEAMFALAGVPVVDRELVAFFERPYREGDYVPPHLLGDWDAIEASNRAADATAEHFIRSIVADRSILERLEFRGDCSLSVKIVPHYPAMGSTSVSWLHNITQQATFFLYGLSGAEFLDRTLDLTAASKLPVEAVAIEVGIEEQAFIMHVRERV